MPPDPLALFFAHAENRRIALATDLVVRDSTGAPPS